MANDTRREAVITSIKRQVQQYEKRLSNVAVEVNVKQSEYKAMSGRQLRRRVEITVAGLIARSNEAFRFQTGFFIGPLSFD
jgi:predicted component of type VI protein secretion system